MNAILLVQLHTSCVRFFFSFFSSCFFTRLSLRQYHYISSLQKNNEAKNIRKKKSRNFDTKIWLIKRFFLLVGLGSDDWKKIRFLLFIIEPWHWSKEYHICNSIEMFRFVTFWCPFACKQIESTRIGYMIVINIQPNYQMILFR